MAHAEFFGDSYQYAHRVLLRAIACPDKWVVHPMIFRSKGGDLDLDEYAKFLGLPRDIVMSETGGGKPLKWQPLVADVKRHPSRYLFLDPDTGIAPEHGSTQHVGAKQLAEIARQPNRKIVLVFDHAYLREEIKVCKKLHDRACLTGKCKALKEPNDDRVVLSGKCKALEQVHCKLEHLWSLPGPKLHAAAVIVRTGPCVCYVWVSTDPVEIDQVKIRICDKLPIPAWRLVSCPCSAHPF